MRVRVRLIYLATCLGTLLLTGFGVSSASATTITFTYTGGGGSNCPTCETIGTGGFSFDDSPMSVGLAGLTAFSLVNDFGSGNTFFTYGLGDLVSFSATLDPALHVTSLSFVTGLVSGVGPNNFPETLRVTSLAVNGAATYSCPPDPLNPTAACEGPLPQLTLGTVTTTTVDPTPATVPEPATLTLLGLGLAGVGGHRWRQRRMAF